jgi:hypothetical protein
LSNKLYLDTIDYLYKEFIMLELLKTAITGFNIIPTTLLVLVVIYWLTVIIGAIDFHHFHIDLDTDADADAGISDGPFHALLAFLKVGNLPFMLVFSIIILIFWVFSMLAHLLPIKTGGVLSGVLFIPEIIASVLITKVVYYSSQKHYSIMNMITKARIMRLSERFADLWAIFHPDGWDRLK